MTVLIGTDLDRTLIYSHAAVHAFGAGGRAVVVVERHRDADASFMTAAAARAFAELCRSADVVPVTTRTVEQYRRVTLPGPPARHVIAANGGVLLVDGLPDPGWAATVARALGGLTPLAEILGHVRSVLLPEWTVSLREVDGLFCYAVTDRDRLPADLIADESAWTAERGWRLSVQGRKLYWVPSTLTKGAAFAEVAARTAADVLLAAGDSLLDADLLLSADAGVMPRHGELAATNWTAPHVEQTRGSGVLAGEEIVHWFAQRAQPRSQPADLGR